MPYKTLFPFAMPRKILWRLLKVLPLTGIYTAQKVTFPLQISSVNVTYSVNKKSVMENFIFVKCYLFRANIGNTRTVLWNLFKFNGVRKGLRLNHKVLISQKRRIIDAAFVLSEFCFFKNQNQPSRGVLKKRCSEDMQQIYRRTPVPKCNFNKVAKQGCSPVNLLHIFRTPFPRKNSEWLLRKNEDLCL